MRLAIFNDQANAAYSFTLYEDGLEGNFDYIRFYPTAAPLFSNWLIFYTTPPTSPTPTPTPTPTVTVALPPVVDGGNYNGSSEGTDIGVGAPGSLIDGEGGGGCFVATASFGSMATEAVEVLCAFRDTTLSTSYVSSMVEVYYSVGPDLADGLRSSAALRAVLRNQIYSLIRLAK